MLRSGGIHAAASLPDAHDLPLVALQVAQELLYSAEDVDDVDATRAEACLELCGDEQGTGDGGRSDRGCILDGIEYVVCAVHTTRIVQHDICCTHMYVHSQATPLQSQPAGTFVPCVPSSTWDSLSAPWSCCSMRRMWWCSGQSKR